MEKINLHEYKKGIADALLIGDMREAYSYAYKQGYDFGLTLYADIIEKETSYAINSKKQRRGSLVPDMDMS